MLLTGEESRGEESPRRVPSERDDYDDDYDHGEYDHDPGRMTEAYESKDGTKGKCSVGRARDRGSLCTERDPV